MSSNPLARCIGCLSIVTALSFVALAGCGDDASQSGCALDKDCPAGRVCQDSTCVQIGCDGNGDCLNGDQACIETSSGGFCSAVECGCANCDACPLGETCDNGSCVAPTTCDAITNPCPGTDICDGGVCRACTGDECPAADCTVTPCTGTQVCNTTTKQCEDPTVTVEACAPCTGADTCGDDALCAPLATGNACLLDCNGNNDCATGFECQNKQCAPVGGRCEGCLVDGCGAGQACNANTAICGSAVAECGACTQDWECGDGSACHNGKCVERCDGSTCGSGGTCTATTNGIQVCTNSCAAACDPACGGTTPHCDAGTCVQCRNNGDCANGLTCNTSTHTCEGSLNCQEPTPVEWNGQCVECTSNQDCGTDFCNLGTHTCTSSQCATCVDPYPACVAIGDDSYCVQCDPAGTADDILAQCGQGATCNDTTYACEGGTVTPTDPCESDADCTGGAAGGFNLACHIPSGRCYDQDGFCDDITAFCPGTDGQVRECKPFTALFGEGFPDPGMGGGGTIPGVCSCQCGPLGCFDAGTCIAPGQTCMDFAALLILLGGGTPTGPQSPVCFESFF